MSQAIAGATSPATLAAVRAFNQKEEGGLNLSQFDKGNYLNGVLIGTNRGISAPVLSAWLRAHRPGTNLTADYMRELPEDVYEAIWQSEFWATMGLDSIAPISPGIALSAFDHGFNRGPHWGPALVQAMLKMPIHQQDGVFGPATAAAFKAADPMKVAQLASVASIRSIQAAVRVPVVTGYYDPQTVSAVNTPAKRNIVAIYALRDLQLADYHRLGGPVNQQWIDRANRRCTAAVVLEMGAMS